MRRLRLIAFSRARGFDAAERSGAFTREGLELEVIQARGSEAQLAALAAGECDIVHTAADNVLARVDAGEADLRIYLVADLGLDLKLVARGVVSVAQLAGKRLGVDATWSGHALLLYALLDRAGVARGDHVAVPIGGSSQRLDALLAGRVDATLLSPPHDAAAVSAGAAVLADCGREFPLHPGLTVTARPRWVRDNGDELGGYVRALVRGQRSVGAIVPRATEQTSSLLGALALRRSLTGGSAPTAADVDRAFDPAPARIAEPSLD